MENKDKKDIIYKILIAITVIIPLIIAFSYAYFLAKIKGDTTTISGTVVEEFNFNLVTENDGYINATNIFPITNDQIEEYANLGTFKVVTGDNKYSVSYNISLTDITISNELKTADFKWSLTCTSCSDDSKNASGSFANFSGSEKNLESDLIIASESYDEYELRLWITSTNSDQSSILNKSFRGKIKVVGEFIVTE